MTAERCRCARCEALEAIRERLSAAHCRALDLTPEQRDEWVARALRGDVTVEQAGEALGRFMDLFHQVADGEATLGEAHALVTQLALRHELGEKPS